MYKKLKLKMDQIQIHVLLKLGDPETDPDQAWKLWIRNTVFAYYFWVMAGHFHS